MKRFLCPIVLLAGAAAVPAAEPELDPDLPCRARRANPVTYQVDYAIAVTPPAQTRVLKVWLPLPPSDFGQEVGDFDLSTQPQKVQPQIGREELFGNRFAYFEFAQPQGAQLIRNRFQVKVWELHWDVEPGKVTAVERWPAGFQRYLRSERSAVVLDEPVRQLSRHIVPQRRDAASDLSAIMDWAAANLKYSHEQASLTASSQHAFKLRMGHCSDYHGLCAALGRALNYPTRVAYGLHTFPKNSPSHCKLEAFLPPYGWVSFDVSETQKLLAAIDHDSHLDAARRQQLVQRAQQRLFRGFREHTWILQTRGTDYDLVPKASQRVPVVRTLWAEADGVPLPDPDPANPQKREFAWMTILQCRPDRPVSHPFQTWTSLER